MIAHHLITSDLLLQNDDLDKNSKWHRNVKGISLKINLQQNPEAIEVNECFLLKLPVDEDHTNHLHGEVETKITSVNEY